VRPFDGKELWEISWPVDIMGIPTGAQSSEKGQKMRGNFQKRQKCGRERKRGGIGRGRGRGRESRRKKKGIKEVFLQKHLGYKQNFYL